MRRANLDDLVALSRVADLGSFTRAAAELGTSTSNLSHTIKRLERQIGVRLLQRNSRSVSPSQAGQDLLAQISPALHSIGQAVDNVQLSRNQISGIIRLTATRQAHEMVIRPILPAFTVAYPEATVEVQIEYGFRDIIADKFDAGIRLGEKIEKDMIALKVGPDLRMTIAAAPSYLERHGTPQHPRDLLSHRCINYRVTASGPIIPWEFTEQGRSFEVRVPGQLTFNEPELMLGGALDGLGVAYLLEHEAAPHIANGALVALLADWMTSFPGFFLYYPSRQQIRPVFAAFLDMLHRPKK